MRTMTIALFAVAGAVYAQEPPPNMMPQVKMVTGGSWSDGNDSTTWRSAADRLLKRNAAIITKNKNTKELTNPNEASPSSARQKITSMFMVIG